MGFFFLCWAGIVMCDYWFHPSMLVGTGSSRPLRANRKISISLFIRGASESKTDFCLRQLMDGKLNELFQTARFTSSPPREVFYQMAPCDNRLFNVPLEEYFVLSITLAWAHHRLKSRDKYLLYPPATTITPSAFCRMPHAQQGK